MKKTLLAAAGAFLIIFAACKKENVTNGIIIQSHDANRMMDTMHAMMDRMMARTMTMDPDIDFPEMMMMHHEGAISMANVELQAGKNDSLKRFAQKVIRDQEAEIMQFETILATLSVDTMDMAYMEEQMNNMDKMDKTVDAQPITGDIDNDFATIMMLHHQAAIDDASGYLHHGNNTTLKTIATNIILAQTQEIGELADWLKANKR